MRAGGMRPAGRPLPELSVVIPVYNEAPNIDRLSEEMYALRRELDLEIIVVDDGSDDGSAGLARRYPEFSLVKTFHGGKSRALHAGIRVARSSKVAMIDGDLQESPADIPRLLQLLDGRYACVNGRRLNRQDSYFKKKLPSRIFNHIANLLFGTKFQDINCGLRVCKKEALTSIPWFDGCHRFIPLLFMRKGLEVKEVTVSHRPRMAGRSKYQSPGRFFEALLHLTRIRLGFYDRNAFSFDRAWEKTDRA